MSEGHTDIGSVPPGPELTEAGGRFVLPTVLAALLVCVAVGPRNGVALTGLLAAVLIPVVLALTRVRRRAVLSAKRTLLVAAAAVGWLLVSGLLASDVRISVLGLSGQHSGALLWVGLFGILAVLVLLPRSGDLLWATRCVAVFGAAGGVFAILDATGALAVYRYSSEVSGLMESSSSLGQLALLGVGAALTCVIIEKHVTLRVSAGALLMLSAASLVLSQSRGAWVGAIVGGVIGVAAYRFAGRRPDAGDRIAVVLVSAMTLALVATVAAVAVFSPTAFSRFSQLSNQRAVIWRSAIAQVADAPLLGAGPEQFSVWVTWSTVPGVSIEKTAAYDPHNLLIYFLLAGGVPGLLLALGVAYSLTGAMLGGLAKGTAGVATLAATEVAFVTALMFAWTSPLPAALAAVMLGALIGARTRHTGRESVDGPRPGPDLVGWALRAVAVTCAIAALVGLGPGIRAEYAWARAVDAGTVTPELLLATADATSDPSMAAAAAVAYPDETAPTVKAAAAWHVDAAFEFNQILFGRLAAGHGGSWEGLAETIELGIQADPESGMWEYLAAAEADLLGMSTQAARHAARALEYPQSEETRVWLEGLRDAD